jgi:ankyrin repeat protein
MLPGVNNIQEAIPLFISSLISDNLIAVNNLLDRFPKLINLKDKRNRNVLMMAIYGKPLHSKMSVAENAQNHNVVSYLLSFYVMAQDKLDINHVDDDGLNAYDWAVLSGNEFARSLISKFMESDGME